MRVLTLIAAVFLAAPFLRVALQEPELRASHWPNGNPRSRMEARVDLRGDTVRHGRVQLFHEDGSLATEGRFADDLEQGRWLWFTPQGILQATCDYERGGGAYRDLYPDGSVLREGRLVGDRREGPWREYHRSGRLRLEGDYRGGEQHGVWTAWSDTDPPLSRSVIFDHGRIVEPQG